MTESRNGKQGPQKPSRWEWVVAAVSAALVLGVLAFTSYEAIDRGSRPPLMEVRLDSVVAMGDAGYLAMVTVRNRGDATAAAVALEGELRAADGSVQTSSATVDFVPSEGHRTAGLIFGSDPRRSALELRVTGFDLP